MIDTITLGTEQLNSSKRFLQSISNLTFPSLSSSVSKKGGFSGVKLKISKFQSYKFATEWMVIGDDPSDLASERENLVQIIGTILRDGSATLKINKANSTDIQINVKSARVAGDLSAENYHHSRILIEFEAEYPLLQDQTLKSTDVYIFDGGGMAIPMSIPMDMSAGAVNEETLTNDGNYNAYPIFTFYGPLDDFSLANLTTGETLSINYELATSNDYIIVDTFDRSAILYPSITSVRQYVSGVFFTLQAGENIIHLANSSYNGQGFCTVEFRDHYLGI